MRTDTLNAGIATRQSSCPGKIGGLAKIPILNFKLIFLNGCMVRGSESRLRK